jgi:hypothetical protein
MLRPQGYLTISDPESGVREADTFTCHHCSALVKVVPLRPPSEAGGWCPICTTLICGPCADLRRCRPWEQQLEISERRAKLRRVVTGS